MKYYSTKNKLNQVDFEKAVKQGLPIDNGLFMPETITPLSDSFFKDLPNKKLPEIGFEVLKQFVGGEISDADLLTITEDAFSFDTPLVEIEKGTYALELFHGPTLAFKDVGGRFMARTLSHFNKLSSDKVTVLVATSGDTGSAVANGFLGVENVEVCILYPKGKVSDFQERQMTTLGQNIHALEVDGTFDDCQKLVKTAFLDESLSQQFGLTSANSINVARFLPQSIYYFYAYGQLQEQGLPIVFSVPSGNYGNLTAGLFAEQMGLPIHHFVAASNSNDIIPKFLETDVYEPKPSVSTISNAMDVGDPSNFARLVNLFRGEIEVFRRHISGFSFSDEETKEAIKEIYTKSGYIADPHGAVGYLGMEAYRDIHRSEQDFNGIFLETAHPIKFKEVVEPTLDITLEVPESLQQYLTRTKQSSPASTDYTAFKELLIDILD